MTETGMAMRVVSWNIELGEEIDKAIDALSSHPDLAGADLVLLQEMDNVGPALIAEALGLEHTYRASCKHKDTGKPFGNSILARGSIGEPTVSRLPHIAPWAGIRRIAVHAPVTIHPAAEGGEIELTAWSVHAEISTLPHRFQVAQYGAVADQVISSNSQRSIVGGDFNTASQRSVRGLVDHMQRAQARKVSPTGEQTFFRFGLPFELDHLFARGFETRACGVVQDHGASDHDPVWSLLTPSRERRA